MTQIEAVQEIAEESPPDSSPLDPVQNIEYARAHGNPTARRAAEILLRLNVGYVVPTKEQKKRILVAFAKIDRVVYGNAYDILKVRPGADVNLDDQESIERGLDALTVCEIKSTRRENVDADFKRYFFAITTAELLVAQSLKERFRFVFVNVCTGHHRELTLAEVLARARNFYPQWSICF